MTAPLKNRKTNTLAVLSTFLFFVLLVTPSLAQVQIWGVAENGGSDQIGSVYNMLDNGTTFQTKNEFLNNREGTEPRSSLVVATDGFYYGITSSGGMNNAGTLFRYSDTAGFEVLYHLEPTTDGSQARGDLLETGDGNFIGTTFQGGEHGGGTLFEYSLTDGFMVLHHFDPSNGGGNPAGAIAMNSSDTKVYGACSSGGNQGYGTAFTYDFNTGYMVNHHFTGGPGGSYPQGGLILANDGLLYGTTQYGGANSQGSIFKINPATNTFSTVYAISSENADGRYPFGKLIESSEGVLMGTCSEGGSNGSGTVFKITTDGNFTRLKNLQSIQDGSFPKSGLGVSDEGVYYGTTEYGGANGYGTIFTITENGDFSKVHDINYTADGSNPVSAPVSDQNGNMIGTTVTGGANNGGTIYNISPENTVSKLHDFSLPLEGSQPRSITRQGNIFYGVTSSGGAFNTGTFYKIELDGTHTDLHDFNPATEGQNPNGELYHATDGKYYGTARFGGSGQSGTIYSITSDGTLEVLHNFEGTANGQFPYGGIVKTDDGTLYGTTVSGGAYGNGVFYSLSPDGTYTVLYSFFSYFDGGSPEAGLTKAANGKIYGLNAVGGSYNGGSLYEYDPETQALTVLHHFQTSEGQAPKSRLMLHSDGNLYGTTTTGANGGGSIFRYTGEGQFEMLHALDPGTDGSMPAGSLAEDEQGNLYGFCQQGGQFGMGTCFKYSETDGFEPVYSFSSDGNAAPSGTPTLFFPECYDNTGCSSEDPCAVAICNFGICEEVPINPEFTAVEIGQCEVGLDIYNLTLSVSMDISPGDSLTIAGQTFAIFEGINQYEFTLNGLPANAEAIDMEYTFGATGCTGTTGDLGTAPVPCPPIEITLIVDPGALEISPEGMHVGGSFQGWNPAEYPMTENANGYWETTITVGSGEYEFNFFNGASLFDGEYVIGECATNGKRALSIGSESMTVEACWASCQTNCSVGINEAGEHIEFSLAPNPVSHGSQIFLELPSDRYNLEYRLVDITGKIMQTGSVSGYRTAIPTGSLEAGMYTIVLQNRKTRLIQGVKRFIIQ